MSNQLFLKIPVLCDSQCLSKQILHLGLKLNTDLKKQLLKILFQELNSNQTTFLWKKLIEEQIIICNEVTYEVEEILDETNKGPKLFLVKWKNWPSTFNSWTEENNLNCKSLLNKFNKNLKKKVFVPCSSKNEDKDFDSFINILDDNASKDIDILYECCRIVQSSFQSKLIYIRKKRLQKFTSTRHNAYNKYSMTYMSEQHRLLKKWEDEINRVENCSKKIYVENMVDLAGPPEEFIYIKKRMAGNNVELNDDTPMYGCYCNDCNLECKSCCASYIDAIFAYTRKGKLRFGPGNAIVECNSLCKCGPLCSNRIIQKGRRYTLAIFKTKNKGWGVKTLDKIPKGSFVMEYVGEVITSEEADQRGLDYDKDGATYLFDLDFNEQDNNEYSIDAKVYGNVSHFVNHSCDPNLQVFCAFINNWNLSLPLLCFFATRTIQKNEELTFDYRMRVDTSSQDDNVSCSNNLQTNISSQPDFTKLKLTKDSSEDIIYSKNADPNLANELFLNSFSDETSLNNFETSNGCDKQILNKRKFSFVNSNLKKKAKVFTSNNDSFTSCNSECYYTPASSPDDICCNNINNKDADIQHNVDKLSNNNSLKDLTNITKTESLLNPVATNSQNPFDLFSDLEKLKAHDINVQKNKMAYENIKNSNHSSKREMNSKVIVKCLCGTANCKQYITKFVRK